MSRDPVSEVTCPHCGESFPPAARDLASDRPGGGPARMTVRCPRCGRVDEVHWGTGSGPDRAGVSQGATGPHHDRSRGRAAATGREGHMTGE